MTDSYIVQCHHCNTRFRVTRQQLSAAHGAVRCGACLHVFNAAVQLGISPASLMRGKSQARTGKASTPPTEPVQPAQKKAAVAAEPEKKEAPLFVPAPTEREEKTPDFTEFQLDEPDQPQEERGGEEIDETSEQTPEISISRWDTLIAVDQDQHPLEENNVVIRQKKGGRKEPELQGLSLSEQAQSLSPLSLGESTLSASKDGDDEATPNNDLSWQRPRKPRGRRILWGILTLLAALALLGQYLFYNYEALVRQDGYRPLFEALCPMVGCTVPPKVDISLIRSSNLVVRDHPEFSGALVVDAILYNRAAFAQPFPLLELRFTDINGRLIATRRFKPNEYLAGELAGETQMPSQTPIRISLEILDPGSEAVNYSLSFHSPE